MSERFNVIFICDFFVCDLNLCKNLQAAVDFCKLFLYNSLAQIQLAVHSASRMDICVKYYYLLIDIN